ncbi:CDP-diacylglycerol--glycerol-3-phosphate 3-phosphatidyltransferase (Phosphatidylglycerophosphate synthase) (PGP synthase) [Thiocapsa sp. KS1]|jgi:CDP-diacylglycerol--glycerol-3-phosphate 3-phosphatidyltransferase/cardiolipin synthase|nr:CDP-diacylglycerol--glycerol-3-phosphate 3-phosphatidyltransferase [Thiocapsa sp. KS1]CRI68035.1 CDP-diacylglycerol--glycerol-3-phosphate 3-phosphatidyltransferase (Phosphatidylglycerophosphate synthase) (PGP synthase) [Thiocapsa sp. KS1]
MWNIPNLLTMLRIVLIPVFVVVFYLDAPWAPYVAAAVFGAAALTDWLDGYLARLWEQTSPLGAFLDPVADKLMVAVALVLLVQYDPRTLLALPAMVIIGREITVSALREWMAEIGARAKVAVSMTGKIKTTAQMISIVLLILHDTVFGPWVYGLGLVLLHLAAVLTLWSMLLYLRAAWPSLSGRVDVEGRG